MVEHPEEASSTSQKHGHRGSYCHTHGLWVSPVPLPTETSATLKHSPYLRRLPTGTGRPPAQGMSHGAIGWTDGWCQNHTDAKGRQERIQRGDPKCGPCPRETGMGGGCSGGGVASKFRSMQEHTPSKGTEHRPLRMTQGWVGKCLGCKHSSGKLQSGLCHRWIMQGRR